MLILYILFEIEIQYITTIYFKSYLKPNYISKKHLKIKTQEFTHFHTKLSEVRIEFQIYLNNRESNK